MKWSFFYITTLLLVVAGCTVVSPDKESSGSTSSSSSSGAPQDYSPGPGWDLKWSDEFNANELNTNDNWAFDIGTGSSGWGNNEKEYYTSRPTNIYISNGILIIKALQESYNGSSYTSARIKTLGKQSFRYGTIAARIKLPKGDGMFPAFWMMGTNINAGAAWPNCGEIDIVEMAGGTNGAAQGGGDDTAYGTVHGPYNGGDYNGGMGVPSKMSISGAFNDQFHVFAVEWNETGIDWLIDGASYFHVGAGNIPGGDFSVFKLPFFILINLAVGGHCGGTGWPGDPDSSTVFPQTLEVDWVRVYQRDPMKPSISISYPATNTVLYGKFAIGGGAAATNGVSNVLISVDNQAYSAVIGTTGWYSNLSLSAGIHTINVYSLDLSNISSWTDTVKITVAGNPPAFDYTYIPPIGNGANLQGSLSGVTLSEYRLCLYIYVPGSEYWTGSQGGWWVKPYNATPYSSIPPDGNWNLQYVSSGGDVNASYLTAFLVSRGYAVINPYPSYADMQNNAAMSITFNRADTTPPVVSNTNPTNGATVVGNNYSYNLTGSVSDDYGADVYLSVNNSAYFKASVSNSTWSSNVSLNNGLNTVSSYAKDFGNHYSATNTITFTYQHDTTLPVIHIDSPADNQSMVTGVSIFGTASDNIGISQAYLIFNGFQLVPLGSSTSWSSCGWMFATGTNTIQAYCIDLAGNSSLTNLISIIITN